MSGNSSNFLCAIDGGGTGCRVAIADIDGNVLAHASGGPANYFTDAASAVENIQIAVGQAIASIKSPKPSLSLIMVHVGLAGVMTKADAAELKSKLGFPNCEVSDDRLTSVVGALDEQDGAVISVGTGTFVGVRRKENIRYFGGWGYNVGDQASGARLGREALEHTLMAWDQSDIQSDLTRTILARFNGVPAEIVGFARDAKPGDFAKFAPFVLEAAISGDAVGIMIMERGAAYLNQILDTADTREDDIICLIGGVGPHFEPFLAPHYRRRLQEPKGTALDGALALAKRRQKVMENHG